MADTVRTRATLLATLFPDNTTQDISPQDQRDSIVSSLGVGAQIYTSGGATPLSVGTTPVTLPFASDGQEDNATADAASNRIVVGSAGDGVYLVICQASFTGTGNATFTFRAAIDGTPNSAASCKRKLGATGDVGSATLVGLLSLIAGEEVTVQVNAAAAGRTLTLEEGSLIIKRLW